LPSLLLTPLAVIGLAGGHSVFNPISDRDQKIQHRAKARTASELAAKLASYHGMLVDFQFSMPHPARPLSRTVRANAEFRSRRRK
jgi:hypothetical protein